MAPKTWRRPLPFGDVIGRRGATMLEALGGPGLLLVRDSAESEGRNLLRALVTQAANRSKEVFVILLEIPREEFEVGLSEDVRERLHFLDLSEDPLGWLNPNSPKCPKLPQNVGILGSILGLLPPCPSPSPVLVLDSLSWLVLREPLPHLGRDLGRIWGGNPKKGSPQLVALLHQDLHPAELLGSLGNLCKSQILIPQNPQNPQNPPEGRRVRVLQEGRETLFSLLPDGSLGSPLPHPRAPKIPQNPPNLGVSPLTFRLELSGAERGAKAALRLPYLLSQDSSLPDFPADDSEDPDEDLEL